ncbi:MAG: hypothetical protein WKF78_00350 [Candidatus Limnocylindrales bacterium]
MSRDPTPAAVALGRPGGASGIGARPPAGWPGARRLVAVVRPGRAGQDAVADEVGGASTTLDVTQPGGQPRVVAPVEGRYGPAGHRASSTPAWSTGAPASTLRLDETAYRRIMGINVDGVVYGVDARCPAMRRCRRRRGSWRPRRWPGSRRCPVTRSTPLTKTAVVGYVRSLAPTLQPERASRSTRSAPGSPTPR